MLARLVSRFPAIKNWLRAVFRHDRPPTTSASYASRARVIEFYVPETFQAPQREWRTQQARGKLIEFSARVVRKSA